MGPGGGRGGRGRGGEEQGDRGAGGGGALGVGGQGRGALEGDEQYTETHDNSEADARLCNGRPEAEARERIGLGWRGVRKTE